MSSDISTNFSMDDGWIPWGGGGRPPIDRMTPVEVLFRSGYSDEGRVMDFPGWIWETWGVHHPWENDIVGYVILEITQ